MNKFWQWMKEKEYAYQGQFEHWFILDNTSKKDDGPFPAIPTKQMLIGYMIEYLNNKNFETKKNISILYFETDALYEFLEKEIKELK